MEDTPDLIDISKINEIIKTEHKSDLKESEENVEDGTQPLCGLKIPSNEIKVEILNDVIFETCNANDNSENALYNNVDTVNKDDSMEGVNIKSELDSDSIDDPGPSSFSFDHEIFGTSTRRRRSNPDRHKCCFCGTVFPRKIKLDNHLLKVHSDQENFEDYMSFKIYVCTICVDFKTLYKHQHSEHMISKHGAKDQTREFVCTKCGHKTLRRSNLKRHMRIHHENVDNEDNAGDVSGEASNIKNEDAEEAVKSEPMEEDNTNFACNIKKMRELPNNYEYKSAKENNVILCKLASKEEVESWVSHLEAVTKETWTIEKTFKVPTTAPRNVFKRIYRCHLNTATKVKPAGSKQKKSRNIDCPAKLFITIKKFFKKSKSVKTSIATKEWPCLIKFKNDHNHRLNVIEALRERPLGVEAKQKLLDLFNRGHSAATAYHTYCMDKMEELGDEYESVLYDRHYIPTKTDVSNLWKKKFKEDFGDRTGPNMLVKLEETLAFHKDKTNLCYKIITVEDNYAAAICTPLMQRALEIPQANEIMFVDASGNCDVYDHKIYFFVIQSAAGGLPVGCILANCQKTNLFDAAVEGLLDIMPKKIRPIVILTDDDLGERKVLKKHWPEAKLLLCIFYVKKAVWRWILTAKNGIPRDLAQNYYKLFKKIVHSKTENELNEAKRSFFENCVHESLKNYISNLLTRKETWCMLYRTDLQLRGSDTNNYTEVMFRLLKDIPLERAKAFNLIQLNDYIITSFENYYRQRLLDLLFNRVSKAVASRYLPKLTDGKMTVEVICMDSLEFSVSSETDENCKYYVDLQTCMCTCAVGFNGKHCKHQGAVLEKYKFLSAINTLTYATKIQLYKVATGKEANTNIFLPVQERNDESESENCRRDITLEESKLLESEVNVEDSNVSLAEIVKEKWTEHYNFIMKNIDEDPENFCPAVEAYLNNIKRHACSKTSLLYGLHTAFKYKGAARKSSSGIKCRRRGKIYQYNQHE